MTEEVKPENPNIESINGVEVLSVSGLQDLRRRIVQNKDYTKEEIAEAIVSFKARRDESYKKVKAAAPKKKAASKKIPNVSLDDLL